MSAIWTLRNAPSKMFWTGMAFGNGIFVAVAGIGPGNNPLSGKRIMTSTDGITWTLQSTPNNDEVAVQKVVFGNGIFVACAFGGKYVNNLTSTDGINWTLRDSPLSGIGCISFCGGKFIALSNSRCAISYDGINWQNRALQQKLIRYWCDIAYGNGTYVAVANDSGINAAIMISLDGLNWALGTPANNNSWTSITYGNGLFVAVARNVTSPVETMEYKIMTSPDGIDWTARKSIDTPYYDNDSTNWSSITYSQEKNMFVAVGQGYTYGIMSSYNGIDWIANFHNLNSQEPAIPWSAISYGNGKFVAISNGIRSFNKPQVVTGIPLLPTILSNFNVPQKLVTDLEFDIVPPTTNREGNFIYESSDQNVATITNNTVTIVGAGTTTITAIQSENNLYGTGKISDTLNVLKLTPSLENFNIPSKILYDLPFTIDPPTSNSDGAFTYSSSDTNIATISDDIITIVSAGNVEIIATQAETSIYNSNKISNILKISKLTATLSNFTIPKKSHADDPFVITQPISNSTGEFSYTSSSTDVATINDNIITIVSPGTSTITAIQSSTPIYDSGTIVSTLIVSKAELELSNFLIPTKTKTDNPFKITPPISNSKGTFSYQSSNTSVAIVSGDVITIVGVGKAIITATQLATSLFPSGTISATFEVTQPKPTLTNFLIPSKTYGDSSFTIAPPQSNSTGSFTYKSSNVGVATITNNQITIISAGSCTITATQMSTTDYTNASISTTFQVNKALPILSNFNILSKKYNDAIFKLDPPSSNSNGDFTYTSLNSNIATISKNLVTILNVGSTIITATQNESDNYLSNTITTTLNVEKALPTLSNFNIPQKVFGDSPFNLNPPISNSNGTFSYTSSNQNVATISGTTITIIGSGISTVTAIQSETDNFLTSNITTQFRVIKGTPMLSNFVIDSKTYDEQPFDIIPPESNSNGTFSYTSSNLNVATIAGNVISINGVGTTKITALQNETTNFLTESISTKFEVTKINPTLSNFIISPKKFGDNPFDIIQPDSNSNGTFNYESLDTSVAVISGTTITIVGTGNCIIKAIQQESDNFLLGEITTTLIVSKNSPTFGIFTISDKLCGNNPFTIIPPRSNSTGTFSYESNNTSVASVSENIITINGIGTTRIKAIQSESNNYSSGEITTNFKVNQGKPSLTNFVIPTKLYGDIPFIITQPNSNSDGEFTYESSNTSVASVNGNTISINSAGNCIITATQAETNNFSSGKITFLFIVNKKTPTLNNFSFPVKSCGDSTFNIINPTSESNGKFKYSSSNTSVATVFQNTVSILGVGTTTITATQESTNNYNSTTISSQLEVVKGTPLLSSFSLPEKTYGDSSFTIDNPTSNGDGSFIFESSDTSIATISGNIVNIIKAGSCEITATQLETNNFNSNNISTTFKVNKVNPSLSNFAISTKTYGDIPFSIINPISDSNGVFSYESSDTSVATILENIITIVGAGTCTITATQSETDNYGVGTIQTTFKVNKATPSLSNFPPIEKTINDNSFQITPPTTNSDGSFTYTSSNTSVVSFSDDIVNIISINKTTIVATQAESNNFTSGTILTTITITKNNPTISNLSIPTLNYTGDVITITNPSSNSTGTFTYRSSNTNVAVTLGNKLTFVGIGFATITATQRETTNYNSGIVSLEVQCIKPKPTFGNFTILSKIFGSSSFTITPPSSNSSGQFSYESSNTSIATVTNNTVNIIGVGTCTITATQMESSSFLSDSISTPFTVSLATPTLGKFTIPALKYLNSPYILIPPTSNSSGLFTYTSSDTTQATISGNIMTIVGGGKLLKITATQEPTSNYASISTTYSMMISKATPTITFTIPNKKRTDPKFILSPISNSTGTFSYKSLNTEVATVSGNIVSIVGVGTATITLTQSSTLNFNSSTSTATFTVSI